MINAWVLQLKSKSEKWGWGKLVGFIGFINFAF